MGPGGSCDALPVPAASGRRGLAVTPLECGCHNGVLRMDRQTTLGIAGVGKMGEALVKGLLTRRVLPPSHILVSDAVAARAKEIAAKYDVAYVPSTAKLAARSDVLVLATKPKDIAALLESIAGHVRDHALVVTLAAGVRTAFVESILGSSGHVVRMMPNLACGVGEGATAFALGATATDADAILVEELMGSVGRVTKVNEEHLDAVTGLSGSGPGFMAALAQAMIDGGVRSGLPKDVAFKLALQTMKGTAELLLSDGLDPEALYRMVATPGGTTAAGWQVMQGRGVSQAISDGIVAASARAAELAEEAARASKQGGHPATTMPVRERE